MKDPIKRRPRSFKQTSSVLDQHTFELLQLLKAGGSYGDACVWLEGKGITVARSTVMRWAKKLS